MRPAVANDWSATVTRRHVTITYTNVLLFYVISFSVLIVCLLIYCVVFICVAYSLFFFSITFDGVCPSLIKLIVIVIVMWRTNVKTIGRRRQTTFQRNVRNATQQFGPRKLVFYCLYLLTYLDLVPPVPLGTPGSSFGAILNGQWRHIQPPSTWSRPSANPAGKFCATSSWDVLLSMVRTISRSRKGRRQR